MSEAQEACSWDQDDEGGPWSACDHHYFEFTDEGPEENNFKFCPFCGRPLVATPWVEPPDDEDDS